MKYISANKIVRDAMDDVGLTGDNEFNRFYRWLKDCIIDLGAIKNYSIRYKAVLIDADCNHIEIPEDVISLRHVFLCTPNGGITEAGYGGKRASRVWDPSGQCAFYNNAAAPSTYGDVDLINGSSSYLNGLGGTLGGLPVLHQDYDVVLGESDGTLFFMAGNPKDYTYVILEYNGFKVDKNGLVEVPEAAKIAVETYIYKKYTNRSRFRNRQAIPLAEAQNWSKEYDKEFRIAHANLNTISPIEMDEWVIQDWGLRLATPKGRATMIAQGAMVEASVSQEARSTSGTSFTDEIPPIYLDPSVDPCIVGAPECPGIGAAEISSTFVIGCNGPTSPDGGSPGGKDLVLCTSYEDDDYRYVSCLESPGDDSTKWCVNRYLKADATQKTTATPTGNPTQYTKPTDLYTVQSLIYS